MGMDFCAYLGHSLDLSGIKNLCNDLNNNALKFTASFIGDLIEFNPNDVGKEWRIQYDSIGGTTELSGPCGLQFTFSEKVCVVSHYTRWLTFLLNDLEIDFQTHLRKVSYEIMSYFNSVFVIYVPDSGAKESGIMDFIWDDENKDIYYIKDWLVRKCGEPKKQIRDIYKDVDDTTWESEGYYIDYINDVKHNL
ncbi:hypothetical protein [Paenibacillus harenae]|uniref:hypothetical protein n=1 Tax=Paenibacillus harenae TaxID=306543 RepID=UPI002794B89E|nr:hypothetical protein [Paenibacillus harenae]MDQ0059994.1 hypothetical protein [Paenibacillus harenae]